MKTKISDHQLFALAANFAIGDTVIAASSSVASLAQQDAWISALITPIIGLPFIWLYCYLGKLHPGKTLIDMLKMAFGEWAGWIISAIFVVFICFLASWQVMSYIGDFIQIEYMTETPIYALNLLLAIALAIGLLYGLEAVARTGEIFVVLIPALMMFAILMNIPNMNPENLLPIFEKGIAPSLKGSLFLSAYLIWPFVFMLMIYPMNTDHTKKTRNSFILGYLLASVINFIFTITAIMVLGSTITARSLYPTYLMAKEINVNIIERIEGIISFSWIVTEYFRTLFYFYPGMIGLCQLFKIKNHKRIVMPLVLVALLFSGVVYPTTVYQIKWDSNTWVTYTAIFGGVVPILILIITKIKKRMESSISTQD